VDGEFGGQTAGYVYDTGFGDIVGELGLWVVYPVGGYRCGFWLVGWGGVMGWAGEMRGNVQPMRVMEPPGGDCRAINLLD
jgi:hypothetical protein